VQGLAVGGPGSVAQAGQGRHKNKMLSLPTPAAGEVSSAHLPKQAEDPLGQVGVGC
jgi:hypothetical protein